MCKFQLLIKSASLFVIVTITVMQVPREVTGLGTEGCDYICINLANFVLLYSGI